MILAGAVQGARADQLPRLHLTGQASPVEKVRSLTEADENLRGYPGDFHADRH